MSSPPNSPPNLSFSLREKTHKFFRSISTKEPSFADLPHHAPPRLSLPNSPISNPRHHMSPSPTTAKHSDPQTTYRCVSSVLKKDGQILSIAISKGLVYTGTESNVVRIWKLAEFTEIGQLKTKTAMVVALEICNDKIYAAYGDFKIRIWHRSWDVGVLKHVRFGTIPRAGNYVRSYISGKDKMMHKGQISSLSINMAEDIVYTSSLDKTVKVWRISDLKCIETIEAHSDPINAILVADDGVLYTASDDATVKVWRRNFSHGNRPHSLTITLPAKSSPVKSLTLTSDGVVLYGGCSDGYIHYWFKGRFSGQLQYGGSVQGHTHAVMCLSGVGNYLISGSADSSSKVWIRESDGMIVNLAVLVGHRGPIRCLSGFMGQGSGGANEEEDFGFTICTGSLDGVLKVWNVVHVKKASPGLMSPNCHEYFQLQRGS